MDIGMIVTFAGITVAGLAGVLGVWMERDPEAPPRWAWVFSFFIVISMGVEFTHSVAQAAEDGETEEAMARVLEQLTMLAEHSDDPALQSFVSSELAAQARSNPGVMDRLEKKVAAKGGDPKALRQKAAEGRRKAAGLPAKKTVAGKGGKSGGKSGKGGKGGKGGKSGDEKGRKSEGKGGKGKSEGKGGKGKSEKDDKDNNKKGGKSGDDKNKKSSGDKKEGGKSGDDKNKKSSGDKKEGEKKDGDKKEKDGKGKGK